MPVGALTDGPVASQRAKVHSLGLLERADHVLMTDTLGRAHWKPSEKGFEWLEERFGTAASHLVYIGDNPTKDFIAPKRRGWRTIRLRMDGQLRCALESPNEAATAELECTDWAELSAWISAWVGLGE